jgi:hypothetical protein
MARGFESGILGERVTCWGRTPGEAVELIRRVIRLSANSCSPPTSEDHDDDNVRYDLDPDDDDDHDDSSPIEPCADYGRTQLSTVHLAQIKALFVQTA